MFCCRTSLIYCSLVLSCLSLAQYVPPRQNVQANPPSVSGSYSSSAAQSDTNNRQHQVSVSSSMNGGQQSVAVAGYNSATSNQRPAGQYQQPANQQFFGPVGGQGSNSVNGRIPTTGAQAAVFPFQGSQHAGNVPPVIGQNSGQYSQNAGSQLANENPLNGLNPNYLGPKNVNRCKKPTGQFSVADDCTSFYNCHENTAWLQKCPDGLGFNEATAQCDYGNIVGCAAATSKTINSGTAIGDGSSSLGYGSGVGSATYSNNVNLPVASGPFYPPTAGVAAGGNGNSFYGGSSSSSSSSSSSTSNFYGSNGGSPALPAVQPSKQHGFGIPANGNNWSNSPSANVPPPPPIITFSDQENNNANSGNDVTSYGINNNNQWPQGLTPINRPLLPPCNPVQNSGNANTAPNTNTYNNGNGNSQTDQNELPPVQTNIGSRPAYLGGHGVDRLPPDGQSYNTLFGPTGPQYNPVQCQPCSELPSPSTVCPNFPNARCFDDVCGGCKARFFVPRPGTMNPFAEVTSLCIGSIDNANGQNAPNTITSFR